MMTDMIVSLAEFDRWVKNAAPGDAVVYHTGKHASGALCRHAVDLSEAGLVSLVQRRTDHGFQYEAQRTKKRLK